MIPNFEKNGRLPEGIHICSGQAFLDKFFFNSYREGLKKSVSDIFDWAADRGASGIFIGGSFVSNTEKPNDIDCLVMFPEENSIPHKTEMLTIDSTNIDIQFCAEDNRELADSYIYLFSQSRSRQSVGLIQIDLHDNKEKWEIRHYPDDSSYEIIKRSYINRHYVDHYSPNGIIVTIHGLLSDARWNTEIAPIASSQKWIFAPYVYDNNTPDLLVNKGKRAKVIEHFRGWIYDLHRRYESPISIIAHSFGTYIIGSYISGFEEFTPVQLNSLILTGSILSPEFNWNDHRGNKVSRVYNEIAPNDQWVKHMPKLRWVESDPLFGNSGVVGFKNKCEILTEKSNNIFDHNNVIKRDVIEKFWLPFLMVNRDAHHFEGTDYIMRKFVK